MQNDSAIDFPILRISSRVLISSILNLDFTQNAPHNTRFPNCQKMKKGKRKKKQSEVGGYYNGVKYDLDQTVPGGCSLDLN